MSAASTGGTGTDRALVEMLPGISRRFRPLGLFLAAFAGDGSMCYYDEQASPWFLQHVMPMLRPASAVPPAGESTLGELPGGILVATVSATSANRRRTTCLMLCARSDRAANDAGLPAYSPVLLAAQAHLLADAVRSEIRLSQYDRQVDSLSAQLANSYEELSLIYDVSAGMKVDRKPDEFFGLVCQNLLGILNAAGVGVALRPGIAPEPVALFGPARSRVPADVLHRLVAEVLPLLSRRPSPLQAGNLATHLSLSFLAPHASQFLAVPLQRQDQVLGFLFALDKEGGEFDSSDAKLLTSIANESAIYLENVRLFDDVRGLVMGLMHSLTSAVDAKDAYTCGHSERVALLSRRLAADAGLAPVEVDQVYMSALLHDVGKIGVPEAVLQKAGKLTEEEFEQMKKHPRIGARILADVPQVQHIIPGVLHHHERYDGRGYPDGLAGKNIPQMGRIICLADSLDAMTSNRTYRRALPLEVALAEIRRCSGTHFDPELAEAMLRTSPDEFRELLRDHHEKLRTFHGLSKVA
ncbi:MAG TPA: HD domain-containing phosphohydrolase [Tepidisphaeraceae bacterium]|jgi:HD-GYP domain-containing protein (c-di-GMP phosphodiesterase class II)|nr:HD domain-containing phosphohydrolase [Tepidisphaeraceae bacterium]